MATSQTSPKPKYSFEVQYESQDGTFKTMTSERDFSVPEEAAKIKVAYIDNDQKEKSVERQFKRQTLSTADEALSLLQNNPYLVISAFNYGMDLFARAAIKGPIGTELEGPGKALAKLADQIMSSRAKLGKPITLERAQELARLMSEE